MRNHAVAAALAGALVVGGLPGGAGLFDVAVLVLAVLSLGEMAFVLAGAGQRLVVPGAAVAALGGPLWFVTSPGAGWDRVPAVVAAGVIGTFVLTLFVPRSRAITAAVGTSVFVGLLVGMGSVALLLLRSQEAGFHWVLALLLLTWLPRVAAQAAGWAGRSDTAAHAARVVTCGAVVGALIAVSNPPLSVVPCLALATVALLALLGAEVLARAMVLERAAPEPAANRDGFAQVAATVLPWLLAPLIAAPAATFLVMAAQG